MEEFGDLAVLVCDKIKLMTKEQGSRVFSAEELIEARARNRWAGRLIRRTEDCGVCRFHLERDAGRPETCEWGITFKVLVAGEKAEAACAKLGGSRPSPREERILGSRPRRNIGGEILLDSRIRVLPWEE